MKFLYRVYFQDLVCSLISQDIFPFFTYLKDLVGSLLGFLVMYCLDCQLQQLNFPLYIYLCLSFLASKIIDWLFARYIFIQFLLKYLLILLSKAAEELVSLYQTPNVVAFFFAYCIILVILYIEEFYPESLIYCICFLTRNKHLSLEVKVLQDEKNWFLLSLNLIVIILLTVTKFDPLICIMLHCPKFLMYLFVFPISTLSLISTQRKSCTKSVNISRDEIEFTLATLDISITQDGEKIKDDMGHEEFCALFEETEPSLDEINEAFCVFDRNRDGYIDAYELHRVLKNIRLIEDETYIEACEKIDRLNFIKVLELGLL